MVLSFTGKGSAFYPLLGTTSGQLVIDNELYVFDCGESVFERLYRSGLLEQVNRVHVILTHLHADHVGSLGSLLSYSYCIQHRTIDIIHPGTTVVALLDLLGIKHEFYTHIVPDGSWSNEHLTVTPILVTHVDNMDCYGYIIKCGDISFYYSGDSSDVPTTVVEQYLNGTIQELYHDTAMTKSAGHCHVSRLCELFPESRRHNIYCMHLDGDHQDYLQSLGFSIVH